LACCLAPFVPGARRRAGGVAAAAAAAPSPTPTGHVPLHGLSAFGDLKYRPDFTHFDYVEPDAPKGGTFNFGRPTGLWNQNTLTFNTLNSFVPKATRRRAWKCASIR
jgi:microcin C transport system substrate-binding protein